MLPRPRRRLDPDAVRARLWALASGEPVGQDTHVDDAPPDSAPPFTPAGRAWRPFALGLGSAALASWVLLRGVSGGPPGPVEFAAGTPIASSSGALSSSGPTPVGVAASPSPAGVVVQVLGEVRHPGLLTLPSGSRVADAVRAAGGLVAGGGTGSLNLARLLVDGEQVVVSRTTVSSPVGDPSGAAGAAVLDLNAATAAQLDAVPGVGPVIAGRIVDWRTAHGRFASVDQLREVSGIGARTLDRLRPYVRV